MDRKCCLLLLFFFVNCIHQLHGLVLHRFMEFRQQQQQRWQCTQHAASHLDKKRTELRGVWQ